MQLRSALDDLTTTTMRAVSGIWAKLEYLVGLRGADGRYQHWGLTKLHGEAAAQQACEEAHRSVVSRILRTPLPALSEEVSESSQPLQTNEEEYLRRLHERGPELLPADPAPGSAKHLSSVLYALSALARRRRGAKHPDA
jgi:hypothetical protein